MTHHPLFSCGRIQPAALNRRQMLLRLGCGFGGVALLSLLADETRAEEPTRELYLPAPHFPPKVKNVIFICLIGGPSQMDTFDYKPELERVAGRNPFEVCDVERTQGIVHGEMMPSPFTFAQYGERGAWVSEVLPGLASKIDELALIYSMQSPFPEHTNAHYMLHTGHGLQGRPSLGAWLSYGLGSENENLPRYVVVAGGGIPPGGLDNFSSGFLSPEHQGSLMQPYGEAIANVRPMELSHALQENKLACMRELDAGLAERLGESEEVESAIENYELAAGMQTAVPELMDFSVETAETQRLYGMESENEHMRNFARQCLLARRLVERGVRFVELTCSVGGGWDHHDHLYDNIKKNCLTSDQPITAMLTDLRRTGLLDETLVVWTGEFGRTPFSQGGGDYKERGRDHNPLGFTAWLAGGGVQGGVGYGATDEFGYKAVENKVEVHDLHATILHLLGLDHERLTFPYGGRDMSLTDVHGRVVREILS